MPRVGESMTDDLAAALGNQEGAVGSFELPGKDVHRMPAVGDFGHSLAAQQRVKSVVPGLHQEASDGAQVVMRGRADANSRGHLATVAPGRRITEQPGPLRVTRTA